MLEYLTIENVLIVVAAVISLASAGAKILEAVTDVKPNDRFDQYASRIRRAIARVEAVLDKLALNPKR